jgi:hypothetical protein
MRTGLTFQPGTDPDNWERTDGRVARPNSGGVQEAIKILSLRLPKVVGAQAPAPMPLLTSQGSGGNPMIDSVVNQVMARVQAPPDPGFHAPAFPMLSSPDYSQQISAHRNVVRDQSDASRVPQLPRQRHEPEPAPRTPLPSRPKPTIKFSDPEVVPEEPPIAPDPPRPRRPDVAQMPDFGHLDFGAPLF